MTRVLVDTNVLVDVMRGEEPWFAWSAARLAEAADRSTLVINPVIYAEISIGFATVEALDTALDPLQLIREPLPYPAGFVAGRAFLAYRRRGHRGRRRCRTSSSARTPPSPATGCSRAIRAATAPPSRPWTSSHPARPTRMAA